MARMGLDDAIAGRKTAMNVAEVAALLSVSERLVYQLVSIGEIPHFRVGSAVRFDPAPLLKWLREKMHASGKEAEFEARDQARRKAFDAKIDMTDLWSAVLLPKP
jgi:excisionase family DNA binding protein